MIKRRKLPKSVVRIYLGPLKFFIPFLIGTQLIAIIKGDLFETKAGIEFYISSTMMTFQLLLFTFFLASFCLFFILRDFPNPDNLSLVDVFFSKEYDAFLDKPRLSIATMPLSSHSQLFIAYFGSVFLAILPSFIFRV